MPHRKSNTSEPTIFLIRHGEKPPKVDDEDQVGLSAEGLKRASGIIDVFGPQSGYSIGKIIAQKPGKHGKRERPFDTVKPLADNLGLEIDDSIERDDHDEVAKKALNFKGPGNVLICWEHKALSKIAKSIGIKGFAKHTGWHHIEVVYPKNRFDLIWCVQPPYKEISEVRTEKIEGLDDKVRTDPLGGVLPVDIVGVSEVSVL